jgi:DNA replication protein DnaC
MDELALDYAFKNVFAKSVKFQKWTEVLGSERLTSALLDQVTHRFRIRGTNGDRSRLKQSRRKRRPSSEI